MECCRGDRAASNRASCSHTRGRRGNAFNNSTPSRTRDVTRHQQRGSTQTDTCGARLSICQLTTLFQRCHARCSTAARRKHATPPLSKVVFGIFRFLVNNNLIKMGNELLRVIGNVKGATESHKRKEPARHTLAHKLRPNYTFHLSNGCLLYTSPSPRDRG